MPKKNKNDTESSAAAGLDTELNQLNTVFDLKHAATTPTVKDRIDYVVIRNRANNKITYAPKFTINKAKVETPEYENRELAILVRDLAAYILNYPIAPILNAAQIASLMQKYPQAIDDALKMSQKVNICNKNSDFDPLVIYNRLVSNFTSKKNKEASKAKKSYEIDTSEEELKEENPDVQEVMPQARKRVAPKELGMPVIVYEKKSKPSKALRIAKERHKQLRLNENVSNISLEAPQAVSNTTSPTESPFDELDPFFTSDPFSAELFDFSFDDDPDVYTLGNRAYLPFFTNNLDQNGSFGFLNNNTKEETVELPSELLPSRLLNKQ